MFIDEAFFGIARIGTMDGNIHYPHIFTTGPGGEIKRTENRLVFTSGDTVPLEIVYPSRHGLSDFPASENIVMLPDGLQLIQRPRKLLEAIYAIRKIYGVSKLIYIQGISDPYLLPAMVYAGVSLFDDSTMRMESLAGIKFTELGYIESSENSFAENLRFAQDIISLLSLSIRNGTLREAVEKFQFSSKASEMLRIMDSAYRKESEEVFPRRTPYIKANSLESLRRPDISRYRQYISDVYTKPYGRDIALILPCSARKPYSESKSHKRIIEALAPYRNSIHELIVTSPVGLVPRELEATYPARFYDIPVIGDWYEDERVMIRDILSDYLARNRYSKLFTFVGEDLDFIRDVLPYDTVNIEWTEDRDASIVSLRDEIAGYVKDQGIAAPRSLKIEPYVQIASYQFGGWIREYVEKCRIVRNYNSEMLTLDGKPFLVYNPAMGKFTINKASGSVFLDNNKFVVEIDDFKPTASVYAVGVVSVTEDVRQEDEVVLAHSGKVMGVGIAKMPGVAMVSLKKGVAVKVRN
ncbi:MAG: DUF5591 domain-containing protein [Thermoplasmataceae archaeon]